MEITKCEFCNTRIANFEVHNCVRFGNQYRQTSANLPQLSSGNLAEDIELITAEEMEYEARWPSMSQGNSSNQQSFLFDMHQQTDCEETAAAEMCSRYDLSTHDQYNPANSDFHFRSKPSVRENEYTSVNLQQSSETSKVLRSQHSQPFDASNLGHPAIIPTSPAQQGRLPGFHQTFGRRNARLNSILQHPTASSQIEYSRIFCTNEVLYSTRNLFNPTNITEQTENFPSRTSTCDDPLENLSFSSNSLCGNNEENSLITSETVNSNIITGAISIPGTSHFFVQNHVSCVINSDAMKCKVVEKNPKNNQYTDKMADKNDFPAPQTPMKLNSIILEVE
ncbi:hypothetical protein CDAR_172881 [Caerostris darwini]|uniref:Uncharacterized protein n=1 Tax=Caerostris darwini TaxID=1538125 RepID=A0AAV4RHA5_9ARAC|nr:hypothetical protein CDAR_172881 [Caerostris darwini]